MAIQLRDPEACPRCGKRGRVVRSVPRVGYRYRRHKCGYCAKIWGSWQSLINPKRVTVRPI